MRFELERGNVDGFAKLLDYHWELSKKIDAGSSNTLIEQIFSSIEELVDGKAGMWCRWRRFPSGDTGKRV